MSDPRKKNPTPAEPIHKIGRGDDLAQGRDLAAENRAKLAELFPGLITEAVAEDGGTIPAVDADALRDLVGATVEGDAREKFGLSWHGKSAARRLALTPSTGTLRPCPGDDESVDWDTTKNVVIEGDNLEVLKLLQKAYAGRVKMCFIDPPYNTGRDFVYKDNYRDPLGQYERYTGQRGEEGQALTSNREGSGRYHTDWLNMMYPRLLLARETLREDGVILITIDDTEVCNLREMCDDIFGEENFVSLVTWQKKVSPANDATWFSGDHDHVLIYARNKELWRPNRLPHNERQQSNYTNPDDDPRGPWNSATYTCGKTKEERPNLYYPITNPNTGDEVYPRTTAVWKYSKELTAEHEAKGLLYWGRDGTASMPRMKTFLSEARGVVPRSIWMYADVGHTQEATQELSNLIPSSGFQTPKPTRLIRRMLLLATDVDRGDIVLDFFAGSASTGHAVFAQNAEDGGDRRFVLVQLPEPMDHNDFSNIAELTKQRLRKSGAKVKEDNPLWAEQGGDTGFRVFKLDTANVKTWDAPTTDTLETGEINSLLEANVDGVKLDRTDADLLWGAMLNLGLPLDGAIDTRKIQTPKGEMTVYVAGACTLLACFAKSIDRGSGEALAGAMADIIRGAGVEGDVTVLLRDSAFNGDDAVKVNLVENLRQHAPDADKVRVLSI